ncbi:MAG: hypothetical protein GTO02_15040 [Candidatus Dadabacteria bacterium]|nr:hypothetical protein [Candidatus Dadabacteria bacterium]NIQ15657.1 hypothetical protein [Candidatus Dadabacteria bacterium]
MPLIHVKSLPFENDVDISEVTKSISSEFSNESEINEKQIIVTWDFYMPHCFSFQGKTAKNIEESDHPVLVEFIAPDFNSVERIQEMMKSISRAISKNAKITENKIFILYRSAQSGLVLDEGNIVEW